MILLLFQNICVKSSNSSYTWPDLPLKAKEISEHQMEPNISVFQGAKCTSISPKPSEWPPTLYVHFVVCSWLHQIQQMQAGNYMGKNCSRMNTNTMVNKRKSYFFVEEYFPCFWKYISELYTLLCKPRQSVLGAHKLHFSWTFQLKLNGKIHYQECTWGAPATNGHLVHSSKQDLAPRVTQVCV